MAERFIIFSSKQGFEAGSDKYDNNSIVFVKDSQEPGIYTHSFGWVTLPNNAVADQILSFVEGKAKWIDKDYYTKAEVDTKLDEIDVTDQLVDYAKSADVTTEIGEAIDSVKAEIEAKEYATQKWVEDQAYLTDESLGNYYNKTEVDDKVTAVKSEILGGAGEDYDTLKEIEQWISEHQDLYDALIAANATKEYVDGKIDDLSEVYQPKGEYALKSEVTEEIEEAVKDFITEPDVDTKLEEYYTKAEVDAMWEWGEY